MKRLFLLNVLILFIGFRLFAQTATEPAGSGTDTDPYLIETWENLYWVSQNESSWSSYFVQTADIDFADADPAINTWDGGFGWTPIGHGVASQSGNNVTITGTPFQGDYNGQYYTISGLYINRPSEDNVGLFGHIGYSSSVDDDNVNIYNVRLENVQVVGSRAVGSLVGRVTGNENVLIERTSAEIGTVTGTAVVGGLVGGNNGNRFAAGLDDTTNPVISQSWANIDVVYSGLEEDPTEKFGGLVGCSQKGTILDSYARGSVTVNATSWPVERVGGLVGCLEQRGRAENGSFPQAW